jgi:FkbM family methyltransferase
MVPSDSYITNRLFWLGLDSYEPGEPEWWSSLVSAHASTLELGANIGLYTILGARAGKGRPYVAVEANPRSAAVLRENLSLNDLGHVQVVEAAVVGDPDAHVVTLSFPDRDPYDASAGAFIAGAPDRSVAASRTVSVPAIVPDDLVGGVDLLKLDIEGMEVDVLRRIRSWVIDRRPTIVVEVRDDATHLRAFVVDLVDQAGYGCVAVTDGRPRLLDNAEALGGRLQATHATRDLTLVRRESVDALLAM